MPAPSPPARPDPVTTAVRPLNRNAPIRRAGQNEQTRYPHTAKQ
jgi:hypothetical protein